MQKLRKIVYLTLTFLILVIIFFLSRIITVNNIVCISRDLECSPRINDKLQAYKGKDLQSTKKVLKKILKDDITVTNFNIEYKIPHTLILNVIERKPKYSLIMNSEKKNLAVDNEGYVLYEIQNFDFPVLKVDKNLPEIGDKIDKHTFFALQLLSDIDSVFQVKQGSLDSNSLVIELPSNLRVIFPVEGDREALIGSLILISNEIKNGSGSKVIKNQTIGSIDLRYKNPILKPL